MEHTCRTKTLHALSKNMERGTLSLTHKLQRREGQWNTKMKSELIDSLLRNFPINPTYCVREDGKLYTIDGVQRLSCIRDYLDNKFALSKTLEPVTINGFEKDIAGKKFNKLDDDTKEALLACELQVYELTEYSDKEIRQMFSRQNAGKKLNTKQLRTAIESDEFRDVIYSLTTHPFISKCFTKAQIKSDVDKDTIRQVLMLTKQSKKDDLISFRSNDINKFIIDYQEHIDYDNIKIINKALDKLDTSFENIKIKQLSVPMFIYGMYLVIKDKKSTDKYITWLKKFLATYDSNKEYLKYCGAGTSSAEMVKGRLNYFEKAIKTM